MNSLIECQNELWKESRKQLKHFLLHMDQHSLHNFRVSVKKLNALSNLVSFVDEKSDTFRSMKGINKMFDHAGELRDGYVIEELSKNYGLENLVSKEISEMREEQLGKLKHCYRSNNSHSSHIRLKNVKYLEKISEADIILFFKHIRNQIEQCILAPEQSIDIHHVRKILKEYLFLSNLLNHKTYNQEVEAFEELQHDVDNKHDLEKLLKRLAQIKQNPRILKAIAKVKQDEEILESKILSSFKKLNFKKSI